MENIWQWGIDVIKIAQQIRSPFLDQFFKFISFTGAMIFYIIFLPFIYWCYDKKFGSRIFILILISGWFNSVLKDLINHPRPYNIDESVKIGKTGGPGIPSGHAQQSLVVWGSLSLWRKKRSFVYFSAAVVLLIAFSRIYLGVHFPTDIIGGWLAGMVILAVFWISIDRLDILLPRINPVILAVLSIIIPVLFSMILASKPSVMSAGALSGFCVGVILEKKYINFDSSAGLKSYISRYLSGALFLMLLFFSQKLLFSKSSQNYLIFVFVHSWTMFLWISAGAPWMYKKFRI
jgi:membrane-associated phospholipid phosphatase